MLLATLACMLGVHTLVLAASPNDNGLLHQEVVDFELPPPLGWAGLHAHHVAPPQGAPAGRHGRADLRRPTNDLAATCWDPFPFVATDGAAGVAALDRRQQQLTEWGRNERKFALPRSLEAHPVRAGTPVAPCHLSFGAANPSPSGDGAAATVRACSHHLPALVDEWRHEQSGRSGSSGLDGGQSGSVAHQRRLVRHRRDKAGWEHRHNAAVTAVATVASPQRQRVGACWAWCDGTASESHAGVSLFDVSP